MASLTPGILLKLLQHLDDKNVKVAGEHRSALLQVISIVPSLEDDPWKSRGYYLRVSDSMHSAYVSVSDEDVELILSDKIQLGQFVHVTRLDRGSPVPVVRGLKPVPKRRPCIGEPKDLISSDALTARKGGELRKGKKDGAMAKKLEANKGKTKREVESEEATTRRLSVGSRKVEGLEVRRLSLDSMRKGWDRSPGGVKAVSKSKPKQTLSSCSVRSPSSDSVSSSEKPSPRKGLTSKSSRLNTSALHNKNVFASRNSVSKPAVNDLKLSSNEALPCHLKRVTLSFKHWSDSKMLWNSLPSTIHDLGKEVTGYRNASFMSAIHALEEASAVEGVIRCMSMFAELCEMSRKEYAGQVVEQFLNLHESMHKAAAMINALLNRSPKVQNRSYCTSQCSLPELCCNLADKNASTWIQAAVENDLSKFSLFMKEEKLSNSNGEECYLVMMEEDTPKKIEAENRSPKTKQSSKNQRLVLSDSTSKGVQSHSGRRVSTTREEWPKGNGLKNAASLAENLLSSSRAWFLNYLECSLKSGFGLKNGEANSHTAILLGQLKRVNQWLDDSVQGVSGTDERIEGLKKNLYKFLLDHVDSAVFAGR